MKRGLRQQKRRPFVWWALVALLVGLTACRPGELLRPERKLSFETLERNDTYSAEEGYGGLEPQVIRIAEPGEIGQLEGLISQEALGQLAGLDFQQSFALLLLRGRQANTGYATLIEQVARRDDQLVIYAQFWEPSGYYEVQPEATSPYHLIKVRRDETVAQITDVVLRSQMVTPTPPFR